MQGRKLKGRTPKVALSEVLSISCARTVRQEELRKLNAWMKKWFRVEEFRVIKQ